MKEKIGWCYYLDRSNRSYSKSASNALMMLADETEMTVETVKQAMVKVESDNGRMFYGECGSQFYEPSKSMDIMWEIIPDYEEVCVNITIKKFDYYHVESYYGCNPGKKCNGDYQLHTGDGFQYHLLSGCSKHEGSPAPDKYLDKDKCI